MFADNNKYKDNNKDNDKDNKKDKDNNKDNDKDSDKDNKDPCFHLDNNDSPPLADKDLLVEDRSIGTEEGDWIQHISVLGLLQIKLSLIRLHVNYRRIMT